MAYLDIRTLIRATPEQVWEVISDFSTQAEWMVDVRKLAITSEQRSGLGTVVEVTSTLFGLPLVRDRMVVTSWDPPHRFDVAHTGQFTGTGAFVLEAVPAGTVFTWIEDFKPPLGPLGELGYKVVVEPHLRRMFGKSMDNVRRLVQENI